MASSLFDALEAGSPDKKKELESAMSGDFAKKVDRYKNMIVDAYMKNSIDLNKSIARIAEKENLNDDQISRIVEEVNNDVYLLKYNQMKGAPEREVQFDIASLPKIKGVIKSGESNKPINQQKVASSIESAFEKTASWEGESGDSLNFLNSSAYEFAGCDLAKHSDRSGYLTKLVTEKVASMEEDITKCTEKLASDVYTIAEALIKYDRANVNTQSVFEQMCKQASLRKSDQIIIRDAIDQKVAQFKEYRVVPDEYNYNVDLVDIDKVANEFSLGRYSFMEKMALDTTSNQKVPVVVTDKKTIRSVNNLIDLASDMVDQQKDIAKKQGQLNETKSKITK